MAQATAPILDSTFSAVPTPLSDVGYPGHTGKHLLVLSFTGFDCGMH
jgi:hypothetical protein